MHLQPIFAGYEAVGGTVAEEFFRDGLCLPSDSSLTEEELARVVAVVQRAWQGVTRAAGRESCAGSKQ